VGLAEKSSWTKIGQKRHCALVASGEKAVTFYPEATIFSKQLFSVL
jgi:hypothetical protein